VLDVVADLASLLQDSKEGEEVYLGRHPTNTNAVRAPHVGRHLLNRYQTGIVEQADRG
jgi:hypothetical protein